MHSGAFNLGERAQPVSGVVPAAARERSPVGFRLPLHLKQMGEEANCRHRSGWPYVMAHLRRHLDPGGILLDDFIERSFQHADCRQQWCEPWVGMFHHPPDLPGWLDETASLEAITSTPEFRRSLPWLKGAIALSDYLGKWIEQRFDIPVLVLKHPTERPEISFSIDAFLAAERQSLVQVGWYARNTRAIYQLEAPPGFDKIHLLQRRPWVLAAIDRIDAMSPHRARQHHGDVMIVDELESAEYDKLLSRSVIFNEYFSVSASNTIVEAMARGVPLLVNRHPAIEEYLTPDYPLLFDDIGQANRFLADRGRIVAAAAWLSSDDTSWMSGADFADSVARFIASLDP
jgi:hypothetical protein